MPERATLRSRARRAARRLGYEVHRIPDSPQPEPPAPHNLAGVEDGLSRLLGDVSPRAAIDVGANVGQFGGWLRAAGFAGQIVSFEPLPREHEQLRAAAEDDPGWHVAPRTAVGDAPGSARIHVAGNSMSSSLLDMLDTHVENAPDSAYVEEADTPVARLDDLLEEQGFDPTGALLKIDTQGYEQHVLAGAPRTLNAVAAVHIELSLAPLYAGQGKTSEIFATLGAAGLELAYVNEAFDAADGRILQLDGGFTRF